MYKRKDFKITQEQLEYIVGNEWKSFRDILLTNCFCHSCDLKGNATIVNYEIYVNYLNDVIFRGHCKKCDGQIARYTETGENYKISKRIDEIVISKGKKIRKWVSPYIS